MKIDLSGKTALVTGSTAGIGLGIAKGLAAAGARVIVNGRSGAGVDKALQTLKSEVPDAKVVGFIGDLSEPANCKKVVAEHPAVNILINNLGVFELKDFFDVPDEEWEHIFQVNVMSGIRLSRAYAQGMADRKWGRIVFIASESAINIPVDMIHYGMTKTAQLALTRGLAKRMAGTGVTVNSVLPGPTLTEGVAQMLKDEIARTGKSLEEAGADFVIQHRSGSLIRRAAHVDEIANMVVYVSSPQASATTGASLRVDGGIVDAL